VLEIHTPLYCGASSRAAEQRADSGTGRYETTGAKYSRASAIALDILRLFCHATIFRRSEPLSSPQKPNCDNAVHSGDLP
jgi:hypothetical protein